MIKISRAYLLHRVLEIKGRDGVAVTDFFPHILQKAKLYFLEKFNQRTPILGILGTVEGEISFKTENWDGRTTIPLLQMHASKPGNWRTALQKLFSPKIKDLNSRRFGGLLQRKGYFSISVNVTIC